MPHFPSPVMSLFPSPQAAVETAGRRSISLEKSIRLRPRHPNLAKPKARPKTRGRSVQHPRAQRRAILKTPVPGAGAQPRQLGAGAMGRNVGL